MRSSPHCHIETSPFVAVEEILRGEKKGFLPFLLKSLLFPPSLCFAFAVKLRNFLYDCGAFKQQKSQGFVVSVGNCVVGGSGKTPFILMLAGKLGKELPVAILSRGYLSQKEHEKSHCVEGNDTPEQVGDEPYLLARNLPQTQVWVGKDRAQSAKKAVERGARALLLDDGMQHRRLFRDLEIVCVSGSLAQSRYLPGGVLRDDPKRLKKADYIVSFGAVDVKKWSHAPIIEMKNCFSEVVFADGTKKKSLKGTKVALFCGLSDPKRFIKSLSEEAEVVCVSTLADHEKISEEKLRQFCLRSSQMGADFLLCTEKDFVKLKREELAELPLPCGFVRSECVVVKNEEAFCEMIEKIMRARK